MVSLAYEVSQNPLLLEGLSDEELLLLEHDWSFWARPNQIEPEGFRGVSPTALIWLILAGRGWGKTLTGQETVKSRVKDGLAGRIALVAPSAGDARDVMIEGPSGIMTKADPWFMPEYIASKRRITWPNGAVATIFSAEDPEALRGPEHDFAWCDELAAWPRTNLQMAWDMLMFGLRIGRAQVVITTTPKPVQLLKDLIQRSTTYITKGSTYENIDNLAQAYVDNIIKPYEGTRLGRQELRAEILDDVPGALWSYSIIDPYRIDLIPPLRRIAIAVDPAGSRKGHEVGIMVGGIDSFGEGYLLADLSGSYSPNEWAEKVGWAYEFFKADLVVVENNFGGDMVKTNIINTPGCEGINVKVIRASRGKYVRAEPIAAKYEQGKVHHAGVFEELEEQLTTWLPEEGPDDRLDANVWLWTELLTGVGKARVWFV